jgi:hypothetical protein
MSGLNGSLVGERFATGWPGVLDADADTAVNTLGVLEIEVEEWWVGNAAEDVNWSAGCNRRVIS